MKTPSLDFPRARRTPRSFPIWVLSMVLLAGAVGCATPEATDPKQVAKRKAERSAAFAALPVDQQSAVDQGQIKVGMSEDAVYIAWGKPAQVLRSGDASGETTTWLYHGTATDTYHYWHYREYPRRDGTTFLDRSLDTDFAFRDYVSAELRFKSGKLESWKMLPKPAEASRYAPDVYGR